jgi:hypothetical protein
VLHSLLYSETSQRFSFLGYLVYQHVLTTAVEELIYDGSSDASKTSFLVGGLLANSQYEFSVVAINQYGNPSSADDNVVRATTSAEEVPGPPTNVTEREVAAGYVELSFLEPFLTGGVSVDSLVYSARLQSLSGCTADCSTCSHAISNGGQIFDTNSSACTLGACASIDRCCLSDGTECGILVTDTKQCLSGVGAEVCRLEGVHYSTRYVVALQATNTVGPSIYASSIQVVTSDASRPGAPQLYLVSASGGSIELKWTLTVRSLCG